VASLLGENLTAGISSYSESAPHIESGRLRALAISSPSRVTGIEAPTLKEQGLAVDLVNWRAVLAPSGISPDDRARLTALVDRMARSARWQRTLAERGWTDTYLDGDAFDRYLEGERARVARIVARLRGPGGAEPVRVGRRIFPIAILAGAALVLVAIVMRVPRRRSLEGDRPAGALTNRRALCIMSAGLMLFLVLFEPVGFIAAGTLLFAFATFAFAPAAVRPVVVGGLFCTLIYLVFTRGLDLALPSGSLWTWMR